MNLYSLPADHARYQPSKTAIEAGDTRLTYADFDLVVRRIAARLRAAGIKTGDLVGIHLRDTPIHLAANFAVMRIGAIILPLDWRAAATETDRILRQFPPAAILSDRKAHIRPMSVSVDDLDQTEPELLPPADIENAPIVYGLTSGTTGEPKAFISTHEQFYARFITRSMEGINQRDDRYLVPLPLAFSAGRQHSFAPLLRGGTLVMFASLFDPPQLVEAVHKRNITALILSPNMTRSLLGSNRRTGELLMPNLRMFVSTTGKLQPEERASIRAHITPNLIDYYGASGVGQIAVISNEEDGREPTAAGRLAFGIELQVVDDNHCPLSPDAIGAIRIRGPGIASGPAEGSDTGDARFKNGWYYPGDIGRLDQRGILHLHGRSSELIKRGGLMVYAQEVERVLRLHEDISDAAVIGVPSADLGEAVAAAIVVKTPVEIRELVAHCRQHLAPFKVPARFVVVEALPRNVNGKVVKNELRGLFEKP